MPLLTSFDRTMMENDIMSTIADWNSIATIKTPKPLDEQTNWDTRLHEFIGDILYDEYDNVPVEPIDGYFDKEFPSVAGDRNEGSITLYVPIRYTVDSKIVDISITDDTIITISGSSDIWRIRSWKRLIGEYSININRNVGV